jgi:ADP-dependent NAD(P)H-hydrate dehydratase
VRPLAELLAPEAAPDADGAKTDRGALVIVGGPPSCPGAVLLAGTAALRCGVGRVQLVVHPEVAVALAVAVPEAAVLAWDLDRPMPPEVADRLQVADAVVVGPGCPSGSGAAVDEVRAVLDGTPLVLDAGALERARPGTDHLVLAPNTTEARALLDTDPAATEPELARALADRLDAPVAVRGRISAVADPVGGCWTSEPAPPGLGTPGSGDVAIGALGALLAQGAKPLAALAWAIALHAEAGTRLAATTPAGYLARELLDQLPPALAARTPVPDHGSTAR